MNTKKCSKCGWEFPENYPGRTCKFCSGKLIGHHCVDCGVWVPGMKWPLVRCTKCETKRFAACIARRKELVASQLKEWQDIIAKVPTPYRTLTEKEWLEACSYFGGCAFCGKPQIDVRVMFIPFKSGGRYCAWNIVPSCEACATRCTPKYNPFHSMDNYLNHGTTKYNKLGQTKAHLIKIVDYLQPKLMEAANEQGKN